MTRRIAMLATLAVALLLGGTAAFILLADRGGRFAACDGGSVAGGGDLIGGPFTLIDQTGQQVTDADVIDGLTLVYFGYTFCPDICPVDVARNADAVDLLDQRGVTVKPVMITVDPARDTPEVMADYAGYMHPRMVGLTGTDEQIEAAKTAYKVYGAKAAGQEDEEFYIVDHTTLTYLMHPEEGFLAFFRREMSAEQVADRVECFADAL